MKISALIPYKADNGRRDEIWSCVRKRYHDLMPQIELCLGFDDQELFCKAKAVNEAALKASGEIFMVVDSDVVFNLDLVTKILALIDLHPWLIPYRYGWRLTPEITDSWLVQGIPSIIQINETNTLINTTNQGAMINVMRRSCFEAVGGFDERYLGWGGEDEAFAMSLDTICGRHFRMNEAIYHMWHQPAPILPEFYDKNLALHNRYCKANGNAPKMQKLINKRYERS